jgi:tetratricopeptide (TPR) repeat protein
MGEKEPYKPGLGKNRNLVDQLKELQRNPRSLVFVSLAEMYRLEGLPHQALDILDEGLSYYPGLASAVLARARCLLDLRRYAEGLAEIQVALQGNPQNLRAHKLQAEIYVRLGQRRAAIRALTQVVTLYPQDIEAVRALEELENLESKTEIPLRGMSRASVDTPSAKGKIEEFQIGSIAESWRALDGIEAAEAESESITPRPTASASPGPSGTEADLDSDTEPTFATRTIAELYLRQGLTQKAIRVLRKMLRDNPANPWARETLQELETDGILAPTAEPKPPEETALQRKAKALERLLSRVRMMKRLGA